MTPKRTKVSLVTLVLITALGVTVAGAALSTFLVVMVFMWGYPMAALIATALATAGYLIYVALSGDQDAAPR